MMTKKEADVLLKKIAHRHHTTANEVRSEILLAMEEGQRSAHPVVQEHWNAIPRKGKKITLEEFLTYLVAQGAS